MLPSVRRPCGPELPFSGYQEPSSPGRESHSIIQLSGIDPRWVSLQRGHRLWHLHVLSRTAWLSRKTGPPWWAPVCLQWDHDSSAHLQRTVHEFLILFPVASPAPHVESPLISETAMLLLTMQLFRQYKNPVLYMWKGMLLMGMKFTMGVF